MEIRCAQRNASRAAERNQGGQNDPKTDSLVQNRPKSVRGVAWIPKSNWVGLIPYNVTVTPCVIVAGSEADRVRGAGAYTRPLFDST